MDKEIDEADQVPPIEKPEPAVELDEKTKAKRKVSELFESDRGRLFVRVVCIKDVKLPDIDSHNAKVCMVLDNGLHSITTPYQTLGSKLTKVGQEFELVVGKNLEFILTLKSKWPKPAAIVPLAGSESSSKNLAPTSSLHTTKSITSVSTQSSSKRHGFAKLFGRSKDKHVAPPAQPGRYHHAKQNSSVTPQQAPEPNPDAWTKLTARDGSFGRAYISFSQYEEEIYGASRKYSIPCYNEWTVDPENGLGTKKSPYQIATLECQLMFIPRGSKKEKMPDSIQEAEAQIEKMRKYLEQKAIEEEEERKKKEALEKEKELEKEKRAASTIDKDPNEPDIIIKGCLSQLGGDCKYWRRRYFKLNGVTHTLTAYSETSRKPRVAINLGKALRVIEDRSTLTEPIVTIAPENESAATSSTTTASGKKKRRKSAFAEKEEGFMFVDEGFRIRFGNGEIIDFYADNCKMKSEWVTKLRQVIVDARASKWEKSNPNTEESSSTDRKGKGKTKVTFEEGKEEEEKEKDNKKSSEFVIKPWMQKVIDFEEEKPTKLVAA